MEGLDQNGLHRFYHNLVNSQLYWGEQCVITRNLHIEGNNLDALKLLQETYLGQVTMFYIDPPYNTGNDFIYDDDFSMSRGEYESSSGEVDEQGNAMFDEEKWKQNNSIFTAGATRSHFSRLVTEVPSFTVSGGWSRTWSPTATPDRISVKRPSEWPAWTGVSLAAPSRKT